MGWIIDRRDVVLLALLAMVSLGLCMMSVGYTMQARREIREARAVVQRADSLVLEWTKRGCAPRTSTVP